jgi:hypothetical protein
LNDFVQGPDAFSDFLFLFIEGLQTIQGKNRNHIFNESAKTDTLAVGIHWFEWRVGKNVINLFDDFININTMFIDEFRTLEKSNSAIS